MLRTKFYRFSVFTFRETKQTYYQILGIDRRSTPAELKNAYFALVKKVHPDQNKRADAEEKFKEIVKAYETLKDPVKRQIYDHDAGGGYDSEQAGQGHSAGGSDESATYYRDNGKKYYENRWYNYRKPAEDSQHEESQQYNQKLQEIDQLVFYVIVKRAAMVIILYGLIDFYRMHMKRRHQSFLNVQSEIVLGQLKVQNRVLENYISERQDSFEDDDF